MKKIFHKIHLWLSIPLGLIVFVICFSGAILVFQNEIDELIDPDRYFAKEVTGTPLPIDELVVKVNTQLTDRTVTSVQAPSDPKRNYVMGLSGEGRSSGHVNPYTGELMGISKRGGGFSGTVMQLHRWLLSREIGKPIVGYTTLFFVLILITGIVTWWPKSKKQLKLRSQVKTKNGWKRFWSDLHATGGMYVFIGLLMLSLTGLTYSFRWYSKAFYGAFGIEVADRGYGGGPSQGQNSRNRGEQGNRNQGQEGQAGRSSGGEGHDEKQENRGGRPQRMEAGLADSLSQGGNRRGNRERPQFADTNTPDSTVHGRGERRGRGNRPSRIGTEAGDSVSHRGNRGDREGQRPQFANTNTPDSVANTQEGHRRNRPENLAERGGESRQKDVDMGQWQDVLNKLKTDNPDFLNISIRDGSATVAQSFTFGNVRASDRYSFDPGTGEITDIQLYKDQDKSVKVRGWVYSLHVGAWGGLFSKILTCIVSLSGAMLPITGYYIYFIKRRRKSK